MTQRVLMFIKIKRNILERKNTKMMEKNNLYVTNLCVGHKSIYYKTPELPGVRVRNDLDELLEDKYVTKVDMEFVYVDCDGVKYSGEVIINEIGDYGDFIMEDDSFYEKTMLVNENLIDLIDEGTNF